MFKSKHKSRRSALRAGLPEGAQTVRGAAEQSNDWPEVAGPSPRQGARNFWSNFRRAALAGSVLVAGAALTAGCLDRPVVEQTPNTSNVFVDVIVNSKIDKIDLLFMIDNSASMGDKQEILREAVPVLVQRLVNPSCVNEAGDLVPFPGDSCPDGYKREFDPIKDIHIGVVTSALGAHGGPTNVCAQPVGDIVDLNDRAELLPNVRSGLPTDHPAGFLQWRGHDVDDEATFIDRFTQHVTGAGERGCGYEASLEGWYRFLVDPDPPRDMTLQDGRAVPTGTNTELLEQRKAFLRYDSLVAIIMLSDEDDCSIIDGGQGYLSANLGNDGKWRMGAGSEACDTDPNDKCCYTCMREGPPPEGCSASPRCQDTPRLSEAEDPANVRCEEQKRRFGIDFLYPPQRYVDGLTQYKIVDRNNNEVDNPLLVGPDGVTRERSLVFLAGIVGVPWQDIATEESLAEGRTLVFLTAEELRRQGRWEVILGDPDASPPVAPTDPLMRVSVGPPREGNHPITGEAVVTANDSPLGNSINGHEYFPTTDRQYACIFELPNPLEPADCADKPDGACDCVEATAESTKNPLCYSRGNPGAGVSTTQYSAKAYPGPRFLRVLRGLGDNAIVASICPKNTRPASGMQPSNDPDYGYNPAVGAIVSRLGEVLGGSCLPRELDVDEDGNVPCSVVEVVPKSEAKGCGRAGRADVTEQVASAIFKQLEPVCGEEQNCAQQFDMCEILPLPKDTAEREQCLYNEDESHQFAPGYCYIDPGKGPTTGGLGNNCSAENPDACSNPIVANCPATQRRLLRFVGNDEVPTPANRSTTYVACIGSALSQ